MPTPIGDATDNWVAPRTWTTSEFVAAGDFNEARDDFNAMGLKWKKFTPSLAGFSAIISRSVYAQAGRYIIVSMHFNSVTPTGFMGIACPFTSHSAYVGGAGGDVLGKALAYDSSTGAFSLGAVIFNTGSHGDIVFQSATGVATWNAAAPFTWATGDSLSIKYRYEAA